MLRLIKYELRRNLAIYIVLFALIFALEILALLSTTFGDEFMTIFAMVMLFGEGVPAIILFFLISNVITYSRELSTRGSYLTFMTPLSPYAIAGSKFLLMVVTAVLAIVLFVGFGALDFTILLAKDADLADFIEAIQEIFILLGRGDSLLVMGSSLVLAMLVAFSTMGLLFFAITLSRTLLENRGGSVPLAILFFIVMEILTIVAIVNLPKFDFGDSMFLSVIGYWPAIMVMTLEFVGSYFGVALLLDKKLSL